MYWQRRKAEELDMAVAKEHDQDEAKCITMTADCHVETVVCDGDGNCFFRAISFLLTGSEEEHAFVRGLVVSYITTSEFRDRVRKYVPVGYFKNYRMGTLKTWQLTMKLWPLPASCRPTFMCSQNSRGTNV